MYRGQVSGKRELRAGSFCLCDSIAMIVYCCQLCLKPHYGRWSGLRPMTPDNLPYVGRVDMGDAAGVSADTPDVYVCCGHGAQGWTSTTATADLLARLLFPPNSASLGSEDDAETEIFEKLANALDPSRFETNLPNRTFFLHGLVVTIADMIFG